MRLMGFLTLGFLGATSLVGLVTLAGDPAVSKNVSSEAEINTRYRQIVQPFFLKHCADCHGELEAEGGLNLEKFESAASLSGSLDLLQLVKEQIETASMPPPQIEEQPNRETVAAVVKWIKDFRKQEASKNEGDPGVVAARRLSNSEYDNSIRDLTGMDLKPTKEFPVDPANKEGFDNTAESLAMSPALVKKYLDAARYVSDHLVLKPDGFTFAPYNVLADTDRDRYSVNRIVAFYLKQRTDYADYFRSLWRYQHRVALGEPELTLSGIAQQEGLSRRYLAAVDSILNGKTEQTGPIAVLQAMWRAMPAPGSADADTVRLRCKEIAEFVIALRTQLVPEIENLTAPRIGKGSQPFVMWKNRQMAANRMRYVSNSAAIKVDDLKIPDDLKLMLKAPESEVDRAAFEEGFHRFCGIFPDQFYVKERARFYLDNGDKGNKGRLLSAGFHSMTGFFRDDGPLYELMLDEEQQKELDQLWNEFYFVTTSPVRQYASYLWYERAENGYIQGDARFDFVRAESKDAISEENMRRFAAAYLEKAKEVKASDLAYQAIEEQFQVFAKTVREFEKSRREAEPAHIERLKEFAEQAFRRPLTEAEREGIVQFYRRLRDQDGLSHEDAIRDSVVGILMSPHFCYRVDLPGEGQQIHPLAGIDLANRLSYFLWASMPDKELLELATAGELQKPEVLAQQARRMLKDDRVRGLATEFCGNWLDFRRFEAHNSVDRERFPMFDDTLRRSMFEEPIRFFLDLAQNDRPVSEFLEGKHTFVNASLAKHYGLTIPSQKPDEWVRVDDAISSGRGGLLPMAVFMTQNSPGLRTSPVKRGYWVVKRLLGENIPAPPPDVPELPEDETKLGDLTLREVLSRHRADKACSGCHERIDSFGLAFEAYGPVGEYRTLDLGGRPVETQVTYPNGGEGDGLNGLRDYLISSRQDDFNENLCRKLLAYGLGRTLLPSDDSTIMKMTAKIESNEGSLGDLVEVIVTSPQFLNKRVTHVQTKD